LQIFIDESGTFVARDGSASVGALGAVVITESQVAEFNRRYMQLRPLLPKHQGEVKGKLLGESDIARVVDVARRSGLIYEVTIVDLPENSAQAIERHRAGQCEGLTGGLTAEHHPNIVAWAQGLRRRLEQMPLQLYVQSVATFDLVWRALSHATAYYSQREPQSLARFQWVVDAKAPDRVTDWEDWWSKVVKPMTQSRSFREPFPQLEDGDYSHFSAREIAMSDYWVREFPRLQGETGLALAPIFDEIVFSPDPLPGLEVADVLTNAVRRALTGHVGPRGWPGISRTMIHRREPTYVHMVGFGAERRVCDPTTAAALRQLGRGGRSMLRD
jgi:hypothetical protein